MNGYFFATDEKGKKLVVTNRVGGIPGYLQFPVPGIPGNSGNKSREFPGIPNSLHRNRKNITLTVGMN